MCVCKLSYGSLTSKDMDVKSKNYSIVNDIGSSKETQYWWEFTCLWEKLSYRKILLNIVMNIHLLFYWLFCEFIFEMYGDKLLKFSAEDADLWYFVI